MADDDFDAQLRKVRSTQNTKSLQLRVNFIFQAFQDLQQQTGETKEKLKTGEATTRAMKQASLVAVQCVLHQT